MIEKGISWFEIAGKIGSARMAETAVVHGLLPGEAVDGGIGLSQLSMVELPFVVGFERPVARLTTNG
ncbi:hypothetical protein SDC9_188820 [bioreactor metagenome]|uniref:Uncharacterized protein n=1 Tax=bioreactor metagenome TaxID=1076179 RepID=A0A645HQE6_9ZZZZ